MVELPAPLPACLHPHLAMLFFQTSPVVLAIELPPWAVDETPQCRLASQAAGP